MQPSANIEGSIAAVTALMRLSLLALLLLTSSLSARTTLETIMQDPDWIGPSVERPYLSVDGTTAHFELKRAGSTLRDAYRASVTGGTVEAVSAAQQALIDGPDPKLNAQASHAVFVRSGDVFVRDLQTRTLRQLTRTPEIESAADFLSDGRVRFRADAQWFIADLNSGAIGPVATLKFERDPLKTDDSRLEKKEMEFIATLRYEREQVQAARLRELSDAQADPSRPTPAVYLGEDDQLVDSILAPDGAHLLVVTQAKGELSPGTADKMPHYVSASAYVEIEDVRTLVGEDQPAPQRLRLIDLKTLKIKSIKPASLQGMNDDPLAQLRAKNAKHKPAEKHKKPRSITLLGAEFSPDGKQLAVQLRAIDNKDRWLATVDFSSGALALQERLTDPAWINWNFNDFGWLNDSQTLWLLSEQSNYSQLYLKPLNGKLKALTRGGFEIREPKLARDGRHMYFVANRINPTRYEIYRVRTLGGDIEPLTDLGGVNAFTLSLDEKSLLITHSKSWLPPQLKFQPIGGAPIALSNTVSPEFSKVDWQQPEIVHIPSTHFKGDFLNKLYVPAKAQASGLRAAVIFVHGAGYTQDVHEGWPYYFREQMFHHLLAERGVVVLVPDYRASEGYGRDFRTAIYRQMGTPELEDLKDSVDWLVANQQVDRSRIGVYGGSYGGFLTLMALFKAPDLFAAGAALRPVTDWAHYNHEYTANILNSPDVDPEAYRISSPIEWAQGLKKPLLISHGMLDDNVFFKDSVRLSQRLIELKKENWELAAYPLERHGYQYADAWLDQYRRIYKLFERELGIPRS